ncbi:hypothetical protein NPIL_121701 [Nephila pilipes]|uniref:Uncharacterized protein n=1 Tax=Nephila pilipes TaxID=299642 RepID=A0A8X6PN29_NEPPI|nr:hypothetical protein NPIL_121701 [Nephila pilipes]
MGRGSTRPQQNNRLAGWKIEQNSKSVISTINLENESSNRKKCGNAQGAFLEVLMGSWPTFVRHVVEPGKPYVTSPMKTSPKKTRESSPPSLKTFDARPLVGQ